VWLVLVCHKIMMWNAFWVLLIFQLILLLLYYLNKLFELLTIDVRKWPLCVRSHPTGGATSDTLRGQMFLGLTETQLDGSHQKKFLREMNKEAFCTCKNKVCIFRRTSYRGQKPKSIWFHPPLPYLLKFWQNNILH